MIEIKTYSTDYRDRVTNLIKQFHDNTLNEYGLEMDYEDIEKYEETHGDTTFIMLEDDNVIGVIGGQVTNQPMSDIKVYQETVWYVEETHRKYGIKLLRHLEKWCAENGITQIVMAFMHNSMGQKLYDFYQRMGYKPMETHLIKDVG